ncbi:hypothetical protein PR048_019273 [Dryococelus australis]|uniref:Uncharacterized protein n=1 Tax=Dryococelus australis TaxID=614101 RepID=A0ABQ9H316_9NEOP|nr:hypothetical protein PR048_019273 [Dryococelus australis]
MPERAKKCRSVGRSVRGGLKRKGYLEGARWPTEGMASAGMPRPKLREIVGGRTTRRRPLPDEWNAVRPPPPTSREGGGWHSRTSATTSCFRNSRQSALFFFRRVAICKPSLPPFSLGLYRLSFPPFPALARTYGGIEFFAWTRWRSEISPWNRPKHAYVIPSATSELKICRVGEHRGANPRPSDYKPATLPLSYGDRAYSTTACLHAKFTYRKRKNNTDLEKIQYNQYGRGKREIPEKTHRPASSSGTIRTCENSGVARRRDCTPTRARDPGVCSAGGAPRTLSAKEGECRGTSGFGGVAAISNGTCRLHPPPTPASRAPFSPRVHPGAARHDDGALLTEPGRSRLVKAVPFALAVDSLAPPFTPCPPPVEIPLPPPLNPHPAILSGDRGADGCRFLGRSSLEQGSSRSCPAAAQLPSGAPGKPVQVGRGKGRGKVPSRGTLLQLRVISKERRRLQVPRVEVPPTLIARVLLGQGKLLRCVSGWEEGLGGTVEPREEDIRYCPWGLGDPGQIYTRYLWGGIYPPVVDPPCGGALRLRTRIAGTR